MPTPADPGDTGLIDLTIEVAVEFGQTKTVHRVKKCGLLKIKNGSQDKILTIASPAPDPPFVPEGCSQPVSQFTVQPHSDRNVAIAETYGIGSAFTYTAEIEGSLPEDPIVIIDRH